MAHPAKSSSDPLTFKSLVFFFVFFLSPSSDLKRPQLFDLHSYSSWVLSLLWNSFQTEERRQTSTFLLCVKVVRIPSLHVASDGASCVEHRKLYITWINHCRRLTVILQRWLHLPAESTGLPVYRMRVRVLRLTDRICTAWTQSIQVVVVVRVWVHVLRGVRLLLLLLLEEVLWIIVRALTAVEAHVCGWGLEQARRVFSGRDGAPSKVEWRFLVFEYRWWLSVHASEL